MRQRLLGVILFLGGWISINGQCDFAYNAVDEFDSTKTIAVPVTNIGYLIPANYETVDGLKIIEEGKVLFSYTEEDRDSGIVSLFFTLAVQEYEYYKIDNGKNILLALSDSTIVGFYNVPHSKFDRSTNMRQYVHTCPIPVDVFYKLLYYDIEKIRIRYDNHKHDIELLPQQRKELREKILCLGMEAGFYEP